MTSLERRREGRYQRRKAARERKRLERYAGCDRLENIARYSSLYQGNRLSKRNVCWKSSVQRYQMNLLRNMEETRAKLIAGENITKGFVEFDTIERGKLRHIRSVHYSERVVQRSTCDNALVPMLSRSLIYDNGACLKGKGVDRSMDRLTAHLQQFYRANGFSNNGWAVIFDFSGYFDNILHSECFKIYSKAFRDKRVLQLLGDFVMPFGYAQAKTNWKRVKQTGEYTGKSLGLGSQVWGVCFCGGLGVNPGAAAPGWGGRNADRTGRRRKSLCRIRDRIRVPYCFHLLFVSFAFHLCYRVESNLLYSSEGKERAALKIAQKPEQRENLTPN